MVYAIGVTSERPAPRGRRWQASAGGTLHDALIDDRHGPLPALLLALTTLAGVVDAVSIVGLNHVFVAAQTGNFVLIGLGIAGIRGFSVAASAISLVSFLAGAMAGNRICRGSGNHRGRALRNITAYKAILAGPATLIALLTGGHFDFGVRIAITILLAASMGGQLALIRYLKFPDLMTVLLTLTMTGAITDHVSGPRDLTLLRRALALVAFAAGVIAGGLLTRLVGVGAALALGLAIILAVLVSSHRVSRTVAPWAAARV
jgi:uncharacterized membrane protein YoaK (UPF0700 family)